MSKSVVFHSTRGGSPEVLLDEVILSGVAPDGGLYVPKNMPKFTKDELKSFAKKSYQDVLITVLSKFSGDLIPEEELTDLVYKSCKDFSHTAIAPLKQIGRREYILELFHGPTFAFKDYALQVVGNLIDYFISRKSQKALILVSTSGDTGSASIYGCAKIRNANIVVSHPDGYVSEFQRRQMTTHAGDNVHCLAVKGNYDDCQSMVKKAFAKLRDEARDVKVISVNSINFARLIAQMSYYCYSYAALDPDMSSNDIVFSVPTGNFGNLYSAFYVREMGLPIKKLLCATNENNVLDGFFKRNEYVHKNAIHTLSPSMDIMVASNFERYIYDIYDGDTDKTKGLMEDLSAERTISFSPEKFKLSQNIFSSGFVDDKKTTEVINEIYKTTGEVIDPHTAASVFVGSEYAKSDLGVRVVSISTAHPVKFQKAIEESGLAGKITAPPYIADKVANIMNSEESFKVIENDFDEYYKFILDLC